MGYITQLRFTDLEAAINFYVTKLGCTLEFRYEDFYAGIRIQDQLLHLKLVDDEDPSTTWVQDNNHLHLFIPTVDLASKHADLLALGVAVSEIQEQPWGTEFSLIDPGGHTLYYSEVEAA